MSGHRRHDGNLFRHAEVNEALEAAAAKRAASSPPAAAGPREAAPAPPPAAKPEARHTPPPQQPAPGLNRGPLAAARPQAGPLVIGALEEGMIAALVCRAAQRPLAAEEVARSRLLAQRGAPLPLPDAGLVITLPGGYSVGFWVEAEAEPELELADEEGGGGEPAVDFDELEAQALAEGEPFPFANAPQGAVARGSRHLAVACEQPGRAPDFSAVMMLVREFGFRARRCAELEAFWLMPLRDRRYELHALETILPGEPGEPRS